MRQPSPYSVVISSEGGGGLSRRRPDYTHEKEKMLSEGLSRNIDFSKPGRYATSDRKWIKFHAVFCECLLIGDSKIQHERRIPPFVWDWSDQLKGIESQEAKSRISSLIQSLLEMGGPDYLKDMFGSGN